MKKIFFVVSFLLSAFCAWGWGGPDFRDPPQPVRGNTQEMSFEQLDEPPFHNRIWLLWQEFSAYPYYCDEDYLYVDHDVYEYDVDFKNIYLENNYSEPIDFDICFPEEEIVLKRGTEINTMLTEPVLDPQFFDYTEFSCAAYCVSHVLKAVTPEELADDIDACYEDGTIWGDNVEFRFLGWADDDEKRCCALLWYVGDIETNEDDCLYLLTLEEDLVYLNPDSSFMLYYLGSYDNIQYDVCFSERISFELVEEMDYFFGSGSQTQTLVSDYEIDLSCCDLSNVISAVGMFEGCSMLSNIILPIPFGVDGHLQINHFDDMFKWCESLATVDISGMRIGDGSTLQDMFTGTKKLKSVVVASDFSAKYAALGSFSGKQDYVYGHFPPAFSNYQYGKDRVWDETSGLNSVFGATSEDDRTYSAFMNNVAILKKESLSLDLGSSLLVNFDISVYGGGNTHPYLSDLRIEHTPSTSYYGINEITDGEPYRLDGETEAYRFSIPVAAANMFDYMYFGYNIGTETQHLFGGAFYLSFADIPNLYYRDLHPEYSDMIDSMLLYGAKAAIHFLPAYSMELNQYDSVVDLDKTKKMMPESVLSYKYTGAGDYPAGNDDFGLQFLGNSMVCYSDMRIRHSFAFADGVSWSDYSVAIISDYKDLKLTKGMGESNDRMILEVSGFPPAGFDREYTVKISDGKNTFSITYSPVSYMVGALNNDCGQTLKDLCAAAYLFHVEAKELFYAEN